MKKVAENPYFKSNGRTIVKWDFAESSKVSTTSFSGIGSADLSGEVQSRKLVIHKRCNRLFRICRMQIPQIER
jgi:hypothetical protein